MLARLVILKLSPDRLMDDERMLLVALVIQDDCSAKSVADQSKKAKQLVERRLRCDLTSEVWSG